jgi:hypothetical protein
MRFTPLPPRTCTASEPMRHEDKDRYFWTHMDADEVMPFFNLVVYKCRHCGHTFHAEPRQPNKET